MDLLNIKKLLSVVLAAALVVGCSSTDTKDAGEGASSNAATDASAELAGEYANLQKEVYFNTDSSELSDNVKATLDTWAAVLKKDSKSVVIEGNCDERGTNEYNMALGERRANSVIDYLVSQGVNRSQLEAISYGEERPAVQGHDESAWSMNRRAVLAAK